MGCSGSKARVAAEAGVAEVARLANEARELEKPLVKTEEQLTAEAELAELRRLTRKQEAAAAKAAKRIKKVAAAAEAAPEEERAAAKHPFVGQEISLLRLPPSGLWWRPVHDLVHPTGADGLSRLVRQRAAG